MKRLRVGNFLLGALAAACAGAASPPPARPVEVTAAPATAAGPPVSTAKTPAPDAAPPAEPPGIDPVVLEAEAATPLPAAPAKTELQGSAAVLWVPEAKATRGFKSVLIENAAGKARVVAERKEPVLVGGTELWVLREKTLVSRACDDCDACQGDPPSCKRESRVAIKEPYLKSLRTGKTLEPWSHAFAARSGCQGSIGPHDTELELHGGVGSVYFVSVHSWDQFCGGAHPVFASEALSFDAETGKLVQLSFPKPALEPLQKRAHGELAGGCVMDPKEVPTPYRAMAAYAESGELEGRFAFSMAAPYMCGTGPGHYSVVSEQTSAWIPPELDRWGKLPAWVAAHAAASGAKHAFVLGALPVAAAKRALAR